MAGKKEAPQSGLREAVDKLRKGKLSTEEFLDAVAPYAVLEVGEDTRLDVGRAHRTGIPEAILAEGKDDKTLARVARAHADHAGRCLITRLAPARSRRLARALDGLQVDFDAAAHAAVVHDGKTLRPRSGGRVAVVTAGTSDLRAAAEAKLVAEELGCEVFLYADVGVAGIHRLLPAMRDIERKGVHAVIVAAGMDGALPSVVGGLVSVPTIGLPISTGYGVGGKGEAALLAILQSCAPGVAVVNIDNGYGAGVLAAKIANVAVRGGRRRSRASRRR